MSAGMSTFLVLLAWGAPIAVAVVVMAIFYRPPSREELEAYDEVQPDEVAPTPEALTDKT